MNYTMFYSEKPSAGLETAVGQTDVNLKDSFGWAAQAGIDIDLNEKMFLNFDVKYIDIDTTARLDDNGDWHAARENQSRSDRIWGWRRFPLLERISGIVMPWAALPGGGAALYCISSSYRHPSCRPAFFFGHWRHGSPFWQQL